MKNFHSSFLFLVTLTFIFFQEIKSANAQILTPRPNVSMAPNTYGYYEYLPLGYNPQSSQKYPLLIAFGGLSQNGDGSSAQLDYVFSNWGGPGWQIQNGKFPSSFTVNGQQFRFIVILPQFKSGASPANVDQVITYLLSHYQADPNRVYITGNSSGGGYCWDYPGANVQYSQRIAATIPTCAASSYSVAKAQNIAATNLPVWATHNAVDATVSPTITKAFVNGINSLPTPPTPRARMNIFQDVGHNCADSTFNPVYGVHTSNGLNIYEWLLTNSRSTACNAPAGLNTSSITVSSANISWGSVTGANNYDVEYKATSSSTWISVVSGTTSTSASLSGLASSTSYDWRVRSNCTSGSSSFSSIQFTTLASPVCNSPSGLTTSSITSASANLSWSIATGANSYNVEYKANSSSTWISLVSGTTSRSASLSGLIASTSYNWRVRSNCSSGSSSFSSTQFTTSPAAVCNAPTSLATSSISTNSATISWSAATGANSYNVEYKASSASTWISVAASTTSTSSSLTGLAASSSYDWRVRSNCSSGSSSFSSTQFTTASTAGCNNPTGLTASSITATSAVVSWSPVGGAIDYNIFYKATSVNNWSLGARNIAGTSLTLSDLTASTGYTWRVKANCKSGSSSYILAQFTTLAGNSCSDQFEPNNTYATAANVSTGVNINAQISSSGDEDYYRFSNSPGQSKIKVTLTNLPADYDLQLFTKTGLVTRTSQNPGTIDESVILNTINDGSYVVRVYSTSGAFSGSQCYTLNIQIGSANFTTVHPASSGSSATDVSATIPGEGLKVYPVPASSSLTASFDAYKKGTADLIIINRLGQQVMRKTVGVDTGVNTIKLDVSKVTSGMYFLKLINGKNVQMKKLMIGR